MMVWVNLKSGQPQDTDMKPKFSPVIEFLSIDKIIDILSKGSLEEAQRLIVEAAEKSWHYLL